MQKMERIKIIGVDISVVNFNSAQKYLFDNFEEARGHYICAANVHTTVTAHENSNYREVQNNSFMTLPDGKPLSVVGKKRGKSSMGRVTGPDFLEEVLKRTENTEVKHYFYGTTQENLDSFISAVKKSYPNLKIVGVEPSVFRSLTVKEEDELLERISESWLCGQADAGTLDLEDELPNQFRGRLSDTALQAYNDAETIPAKAAMRAMIAHSDNNAVTLLTTHWPANESSGFQQFLADYGFAYAATCDLTPQTGIIGMASTGEFANIVSAVYDYLDSGSAAAAYLKTCMLAADHDILYVPDGVPAAKKYGSWDYAYHDVAIVYAKHPYWIVCMTDQGDENVDFPEEPTQAMQTLGQLVYEYWNP